MRNYFDISISLIPLFFRPGVIKSGNPDDKTTSASDNTEKGETIRAIVTYNLYRLWFSYPTVMGITWWNLTDGGVAPGEPSFSGIYTKEVKPKPVYDILEWLIHHERKTSLKIKADKSGVVKFRDFRGTYRLSWSGEGDKMQYREFTLDE